ncbi:MAG: hypothetical protein ACLP50_26925 [Solirubrobacteraceae bacterium]
MVLEDARRRLLVRLFGIAREDQLIITLILFGLAADALSKKAAAIARAPGPTVPSSLMGAAALNEGAHWLAGEWSQDTPLLVPLVAFAVIAKYHPVVTGSIRAVRASIHGAVIEWRKALTYGVRPTPAGSARNG